MPKLILVHGMIISMESYIEYFAIHKLRFECVSNTLVDRGRLLILALKNITTRSKVCLVSLLRIGILTENFNRTL